MPSRLAAAFLLGALASAVGAQPTAQADAKVLVASGGVSVEEREALDRDSRFNLKVVLATRSGHYMSDVAVTIVDARGNAVASTLTEGPWLLARLSPGNYRVTADYRGVTQGRAVVVRGERRQEVVLQWPDELAGSQGSPR
jgi:hypothetical protein